MWLRALGKAAIGMKHVYSIVFFGVLTWHVLRHNFDKKEEQRNWQARGSS